MLNMFHYFKQSNSFVFCRSAYHHYSKMHSTLVRDELLREGKDTALGAIVSVVSSRVKLKYTASTWYFYWKAVPAILLFCLVLFSIWINLITSVEKFTTSGESSVRSDGERRPCTLPTRMRSEYLSNFINICASDALYLIISWNSCCYSMCS